MSNNSNQQDFKAGLGRRSADGFAVSLAPMIDLIFLLLIFFLVSSKFRPDEEFLPLQLPKAAGQSLAIGKPQPLAIYIQPVPKSLGLLTEGCEVHIDNCKNIEIRNDRIEEDLVVLLENLRECISTQKRCLADPVELICENEVQWDYVAKLYNVLYGAGLNDITFVIMD
ncbi:MAG: biopolymer transporter ExbD [Sedimentisphaerales bacterium]|nr:biopolymer transporter ExbD [Sedimentisphaerales bacterium]